MTKPTIYCDRMSFVSHRHRCDRPATETGRCPKHNEPQHADVAAWYPGAHLGFTSRKKRRAIANAKHKAEQRAAAEAAQNPSQDGTPGTL